MCSVYTQAALGVENSEYEVVSTVAQTFSSLPAFLAQRGVNLELCELLWEGISHPVLALPRALPRALVPLTKAYPSLLQLKAKGAALALLLRSFSEVTT